MPYGAPIENKNMRHFFNMSKQFLAPGGMNAECVQIRDM